METLGEVKHFIANRNGLSCNNTGNKKHLKVAQSFEVCHKWDNNESSLFVMFYNFFNAFDAPLACHRDDDEKSYALLYQNVHSLEASCTLLLFNAERLLFIYLLFVNFEKRC